MADTLFVDEEGSIDADWLNPVNKDVYMRSSKAILAADTPLAGEKRFVSSSDGGWFKAVTGAAPGTYADNGGSYCGTQFIPTGGDGSTAWVRDDQTVITPEMFGATGGGITEDTTAIGLWFDYLIANDYEGDSGNGTYLVDYITKVAASGIKIKGNGIFKATGSTRLNMIRFTGVTSKIELDGITIDGNDIVARTLEITNTASATLGSIYISPTVRLINTKNNTPDTNTAFGLRVEGNFSDVIFEGEIDEVNDTRTTGASVAGISITWTTVYWVRNTVLTGSARIRNVKNSNTVLGDADGIRCFAPTTEYAALTVEPGALFEECKGRAIKSQVLMSNINAPIIRRTLYDGKIEIDLQYAGGHVTGAQIFHDGTRVNSVINTSTNLTPVNSHCTISENTLIVTGTPSSNTTQMVQSFGTDATDAIVNQGVTIRDNKVKGTVEYMATIFGANVIDTNRVIVDGNWAENINTSFIWHRRVQSDRAQMSIVFTNNWAENACTGATIVANGDLIVEADRNNHNITPLLAAPYEVTIATGVITVYGSSHLVDTEADAASDDLNTITGANRSEDDWLTLRAANTARTVVLKDGAGNLVLAGDFSLDNTEDRIVLSFDGTNWVELFRSDNGA
jgi:hypothetical protein